MPTITESLKKTHECKSLAGLQGNKSIANAGLKMLHIQNHRIERPHDEQGGGPTVLVGYGIWGITPSATKRPISGRTLPRPQCRLTYKNWSKGNW